MDDDCFLPGFTRPIADISKKAHLSAAQGNPEPVRSGLDRVYKHQDNGWWGQPGEFITYQFGGSMPLSRVRLVFDSDQSDKKRMPCWYPRQGTSVQMPGMLVRSFALDAQDSSGSWQRVLFADENYNRLVKIPLIWKRKPCGLSPFRPGEQTGCI